MFQGFTDETVDFMWGIRLNNRRDWFEAHKEEYRACFQRPMQELAGEVYDFLRERYPRERTLTCKVSRIYKDARRLRGQGPYRDHLWFSIQQPAEQWSAAPCFWFQLGPEVWSYGLGYYSAKPVTMARLRARMDARPKEMEKLTRALSRRKELALDGEEYTKPRSQPASALLEPWYRKKNFTIYHEEKLSDPVFSREIVGILEEAFTFLMPFYQYFVTLDGDPDPREA